MNKYTSQPVVISAEIFDILKDLCEMADTIVPNGDYIHVEALDLDDGSYSAVRFYEKYGFQYDSRAGSDAARMFYPIELGREC